MFIIVMNHELSREGRIRVLLTCCLSLFIVGLDVTVLNVALPTIDHELHAGVSGLQWTIDAYTVVMASLLMLGGATADRLGRRRVFIVGLGVFTFASLLCGLAPTTGALLAARVLQAVGASMLNPVAMSIITNTFTDPRERAQAIGVWAAVFGLSMALGPVVGGTVVEAFGWRPIFWLNLPVGLAAIALTLRYVPESKADVPRRPDPAGQVLVTVFLAALTFAIIETNAAVGVVAAAALVALLIVESRREEPLIDLSCFRAPPFSASISIAVLAFAAFGGFLFLNTLYLQQSRGYSPLQAGLATVPLALMTVVMAPLSGRIVGRRGPRLPLAIAGVTFTAACGLLTQTSATTPLAQLLVAYLVFGIGMGFVNAPVTNAAVSGLPRAQAGVAAAMATTSRQVGQALGVAITGAIVAGDAQAAWWVLAATGPLILVLARLT